MSIIFVYIIIIIMTCIFLKQVNCAFIVEYYNIREMELSNEGRSETEEEGRE